MNDLFSGTAATLGMLTLGAEHSELTRRICIRGPVRSGRSAATAAVKAEPAGVSDRTLAVCRHPRAVECPFPSLSSGPIPRLAARIVAMSPVMHGGDAEQYRRCTRPPIAST